MGEALFPRLIAPDDEEAIRIGSAALTYRRLAGAAATLGRRLTGAERAAVWAEPRLETCVSVVAGLSSGITVVPINPGSGSRELEHIVSDSRPTVVLTRRHAVLPAELASVERFDVELDGAGDLPDRLEAEQAAIILYTSGTTGPPKGVQIPRRAIESNLDSLAEIWRWTSADRLAHALPLFHVHGLVLGVLGPLRRGGGIEHVERFSPDSLADALRRGATMVFMVPTMVHRIRVEAEARPEIAKAFSTARLLVSGSAPLPAVEHRRMEAVTGRRIVERYGMTETLMNVSARVDGERIPGQVGLPLPGVDVRLVDDAGVEFDACDDETIGEIQVRGPNVFIGYLNRAAETEEAFADGWFKTGDLATRAPGGYLRIVGRRTTDLIKSGGYRIGAGEIENALLEHPAVAEAAVAGRPDDDLGERVVAWVVRSPESSPSADELQAHVGSLIASHKRPREIHFVDTLPRNAMGKILKSELGQEP